jgi:hypothetical protein
MDDWKSIAHFLYGDGPADRGFWYSHSEWEVDGLTIAHWLFITACHTSLHIGRIQLLRATLENKPERAC